MAEPRITPSTIAAAHREFLRLEAQGVGFDHVVITRDVTIPELLLARREWFDRVKVALLTDGSLVITDVRRNMYDAAMANLARQLGAYARANGLVVREHPSMLMRDGCTTMPSLVLAIGAPSSPAVDDDDDDDDEDA